MKIHYLGTCSGTEPMRDMHHSSLIIDINGKLLWFDAGENAAYRAHTSGIDIMKTKALFVSHPHIDHIGGLANLLCCINKLIWRYETKLAYDNTLNVYFPDYKVFDAIKTVATAGRFSFHYGICEHPMLDGVIFEDEDARVTAFHNRHMHEDGSSGWHSYSFIIDTEGRRIVHSGDLAAPSELDSLLASGCDLLIMETGHHALSDVLEYAFTHGVRHLCLTHHGREILADVDGAEERCREYSERSGMKITLCRDGTVCTV